MKTFKEWLQTEMAPYHNMVHRSSYTAHVYFDVVQMINEILKLDQVELAFKAGKKYKERIDVLYSCLKSYVGSRHPFQYDIENYDEAIIGLLKEARRCIVYAVRSGNMTLEGIKGKSLLCLQNALEKFIEYPTWSHADIEQDKELAYA